MRNSARHARLAAAFAALLPWVAVAQQGTRPAEGIRDLTPRHHALTNARIVIAPGRVIERGTVVLRDGRIVSVGAGEAVPEGARRWDLAGKTVYAGFIDLASVVGLPQALRAPAPPPMPGMGRGMRTPPPAAPPETGARHWNRRIRPERNAGEALEPNADEIKALRGLGFAAALAVPDNGILRGNSSLISLRDSIEPRELVLAAPVFAHASLEAASPFSGDYPVSTMGSIALVRQTFADAAWQRDLLARERSRGGIERPEANLALDALVPVLAGDRRVMFTASDELDVGRIAALGAEFELDYGIIGSGTEYRVAQRLATSGVPVVVPLNFPTPPEVERPESALSVPLAELQHWEQAPANAARLAERGVPIALTTRGLKDAGKEFWPNLRRAVAAGLGADGALKALTETPAELLGMSDRLGRVESGRLANLVVADAELFTADKSRVYEVWVDGVRHEIAAIAPLDPNGTWSLSWTDGRGPAQFEISGSGPYEVKAGEVSAKAQLSGNRLVLAAPNAWFGGGEGTQSLSLMLRADALDGVRALEDGGTAAVRGQRVGPATASPAGTTAVAATSVIPAAAGYPAGEHARTGLPAQPRSVLVQGATIWTMGPEGRIDDGDLLVKDGRIVAVGRGLDAPAGAVVVDGRGKHVTPGLIDAHSHTALSGNLNEASHAVTTEVRIADIVDPTDINVYRQLAGGVTTALLLHGSANPMGGQSHTVKWRWGADAAGYAFEGAKPGVKFALGENVKQSNWGDNFTTRYPQTRMGVEQIMLDSFNAAREYDRRMTEWRRRPSGEPPRRDLRLEALAEILRRERVVHIHSYRQDEILMFVRLAQQFGFEVATFTHILEGYKVADQLAEINAGASTFSDWWAFKVEVYDAIPYNAKLMVDRGVLTSINSDSDEMARRLNAEAAKAMRYGGLSETDALALVTINPARQLRVDARVGSLEPGKDADFVLWNRSPLSSMARVEQTWIDGRKFFDVADDAADQARHAAERERLVELIMPKRLEVAGLSGTPRGGDAATQPGKDGPPTLGWWYAREAAQHTIEELALMYATGRGLYHSGQDVLSCSVNDHAH